MHETGQNLLLNIPFWASLDFRPLTQLICSDLFLCCSKQNCSGFHIQAWNSDPVILRAEKNILATLRALWPKGWMPAVVGMGTKFVIYKLRFLLILAQPRICFTLLLLTAWSEFACWKRREDCMSGAGVEKIVKGETVIPQNGARGRCCVTAWLGNTKVPFFGWDVKPCLWPLKIPRAGVSALRLESVTNQVIIQGHPKLPLSSSAGCGILCHFLS